MLKSLNKHQTKQNYMTNRIPENFDTVIASQNQLSSNKPAQKKLFQDDDLFPVSPVKRAKPAYEVEFPVSTLSPASSPNKRIANIAFPPASPGQRPRSNALQISRANTSKTEAKFIWPHSSP